LTVHTLVLIAILLSLKAKILKSYGFLFLKLDNYGVFMRDGLNSTKLYKISVCAMTKFGCGESAELKNVETGRNVRGNII